MLSLKHLELYSSKLFSLMPISNLHITYISFYYLFIYSSNRKSKWEMAYQRQLRDWMHNSHVVLLVGHFLIRNDWCSREDVKVRYIYNTVRINLLLNHINFIVLVCLSVSDSRSYI